MENPKPEEVKDVKNKKELSEADLNKVAGGAADIYLQLDGIEGESKAGKTPPKQLE